MATRKMSLRNCRVGVVGLGYVGLPLAVEFGKLETSASTSAPSASPSSSAAATRPSR